MKKASEYQQHPEECRALAEQMLDPEQRAQLLDMAETWERFAKLRHRQAEQGGHAEQ
jgi:hypothetical protein